MIGPRAPQPRSVQYAVALSNRVISMSVTHLVAETYPYRPGDDEPRRVAVLDGQRCAVHADRQQGVAAVEQNLEGSARGEGVTARRQRHVCVGGDACFFENVLERVADPRCVAHEITADDVGHASQGDGLFHCLSLRKVGERQLDLAVHHAVDPQRPRIRRHPRYDQCGVDAVEVVVRGDVRREAVDLQVRPRRYRGLRGRRGQHEAESIGGDCSGRGEHSSGCSGDDAEYRGTGGEGEEAASVHALGRRRGGTDEGVQYDDAHDDAADGRDCVEGRRVGGESLPRVRPQRPVRRTPPHRSACGRFRPLRQSLRSPRPCRRTARACRRCRTCRWPIHGSGPDCGRRPRTRRQSAVTSWVRWGRRSIHRRRGPPRRRRCRTARVFLCSLAPM